MMKSVPALNSRFENTPTIVPMVLPNYEQYVNVLRTEAPVLLLDDRENFWEQSPLALSPSEPTVTLGFEAVVPACYSHDTLMQTKKLLAVMAEYATLFSAKQEAYSRGNIDAFGELGVLVRASDKVNRLKSLIVEHRVNDLPETVRDTWTDLLGYAAIGLMTHDGTW